MISTIWMNLFFFNVRLNKTQSWVIVKQFLRRIIHTCSLHCFSLVIGPLFVVRIRNNFTLRMILFLLKGPAWSIKLQYANEDLFHWDSCVQFRVTWNHLPRIFVSSNSSFLSFFRSLSFCPFFISFSLFFLSFLPSFLSFFLPSFLPSFLRSFLSSFVPSFLPSFLPSSLPVASSLRVLAAWHCYHATQIRHPWVSLCKDLFMRLIIELMVDNW